VRSVGGMVSGTTHLMEKLGAELIAGAKAA